MLYGAIEAGGTKFVCAVADEEFNIIDKIKIDTLTPEYTMSKTKDFFRKYTPKMKAKKHLKKDSRRWRLFTSSGTLFNYSNSNEYSPIHGDYIG